MKNYNLATILKERLSPEHQVELWLIKAENKSLSTQVDTLKDSLSLYQEEADELGISYAGSLTVDDEPTKRELAHALDQDHLNSIKEDSNPHLRRSNFRYLEKQYNEIGHYTRYILANGGERIITDDELQENPYLARQVAMSDAREEGDFEEYNRLKKEPITPKETINYEPQFEQCFVKIWSKLIWDVFNLPLRKLKESNEIVIKYISGLCWIDLQKIKTKIENKINDTITIKIVNLNDKCLAKLS